jgi:hypothetical protein
MTAGNDAFRQAWDELASADAEGADMETISNWMGHVVSLAVAGVLTCGAPLRASDSAKERPAASGQPPEEDKCGGNIQKADAEKIAKAVRAELKENKTLQVGLSVGMRMIPDRSDRRLRDAAISPLDGRLLVDESDGTSVILSGVVVAYPFRGDSCEDQDATCKAKRRTLRNIGFLVNINLADFTADNVGVFNKSVEGGIGFAWRMNSDFGVGLTVERAFSRRLRAGIPLYEPLVVDGKALTAIDVKDNRFFHDDNVTALSLKFIYAF